ncbi:MAG: prepilin-type N-terminal cleavage/methylation domain-containing protein [Candidatus Paceibacterota bacterium]
MYMSFLNKKNIQKGFTLVESLVAILIFSISVTTMLVFLGGGISEIDYVKRKVVANYLAQEGMEYIRNMRDTHMLYTTTGTGWPDFVTQMQACDATFSSDGCYYDPTVLFSYAPPQEIIQTPVIGCTGECPRLRYNPNTLEYDYNLASEETSYVRTITVSVLPGQEEMYVYSKVKWNIKGQEYEVSFGGNLFNWPGQ